RVFYGRTGALEEAMAAEDSHAALEEVLRRNIHPDDETAPDQSALARYLQQQATTLAATSRDEIIHEANVYEGEVVS
ncbi:MAG: ubiquinol-cytochrome C chaperone family protein, partial [Pseudomonadota bacterium]